MVLFRSGFFLQACLQILLQWVNLLWEFLLLISILTCKLAHFGSLSLNTRLEIVTRPFIPAQHVFVALEISFQIIEDK